MSSTDPSKYPSFGFNLADKDIQFPLPKRISKFVTDPESFNILISLLLSSAE